MGRPTKPIPEDSEKRIEILCAFVQENFGVTMGQLQNPNRKHELVNARFFWVKHGIDFYKNLKSCADFIGERHHSSVIYARDKYDETMSSRFPSTRKRLWSKMEARYKEYLKSLGYEKHDTIQVATDAVVAH